MKKTFLAFLFIVTFCSCLIYSFFVPVAKTLHHQEVIERVMGYQMTNIVERCKQDFHYTDDDMDILEQELKRFLILSILNQDQNKKINMYSQDVDNLWHTFIIFTQEYAVFCNRHVGQFLHHIPKLEKDKKLESREDSVQQLQDFIKIYETIFQQEVHPIWFLDGVEHQF